MIDVIKAKPMVRTSITISPEFYNLAKKNRIKISEATRVGLSLMFAEKGIKEYDNRLNVVRRMEQMKLLLETKSNELEELKVKYQILK